MSFSAESTETIKKGVNIFDSEEKAGFSDTYRKQCARCHVWGEGRNKRGDLRASGCAACHVLYGNDGKYDYIKDREAPPFDEHAKPQEPLFTKEYLHVRKVENRSKICRSLRTDPWTGKREIL